MKLPHLVRRSSEHTRRLGWGRLLDGGRAVPIFAIVAVVSLVLGLVLARFVQPPVDAAQNASESKPGLITATVEKKSLRNQLTVRADASFADAVSVNAPTSVPGGTPVVTGTLPEIGDHVKALSVPAEVSGRPIIVLPGSIPAYRTLSIGSRGDDVLQLKSALVSVDIDCGDASSDLYDEATAAGVAELYRTVGYDSAVIDPNADELVLSAEGDVTSATANLASAKRALTAARHALTPQGRLELTNLVLSAKRAEKSAKRALELAHATTSSAIAATASATAANARAQQTSSAAAQAVVAARDAATAAQSSVDSASPAGRDAALDALAAANETLAARQAAADSAATDASASASTLAAAVLNETSTKNAEADASDSLATAKDATELAVASRAAALASPDTAEQEAAVSVAQSSLTSAQTGLDSAREAALAIVPAGEIAFLSQLPRRVDEVSAVVGVPPTGPLLALSGADLALVASVSKADAALLAVGDDATFDPADGGAPIEATVSAISATPPTTSTDEDDDAAQTPTASRMLVSLVPTGLSDEEVKALNGSNVRVTIPVGDSADDVLTVPIAAVSVGPGGGSRVEVVGDDGSTEFVDVTTGLVAQGEVAVTDSSGVLAAGVAVVVGR